MWDNLASKLNSLTNRQVVVIIAVFGFVVYFTGLHNPFIGDDIPQIVNNPLIHSLSHVGKFFNGGTFFHSYNPTSLSSNDYRPLMTTSYALIYALFGLRAVYFHVFQLLVFLGSVFLLYKVFCRFFQPQLALVFALIFLVHPLNSQSVFYAAALQDTLYFFFGLLALWLLIRFSTVKSLIGVALCILLSLLAKETGVIFVVLAGLYLFWFDRRRLLPFMGIISIPVVAYVVLRLHAVGLTGFNQVAPIDRLNLGQRLLTAPSVVWFYFEKLIFPWKLASGYYWTVTSFSFMRTVLPFIGDAAIVTGIVLGGLYTRRIAPNDRTSQRMYWLFAACIVLGIVPYLQLVPLDMTACDTWFMVSMIGVFGLAAVMFCSIQHKVRAEIFIPIILIVLCLLGIRTALRGTEWSSVPSLGRHDIAATSDNYAAYISLADYYIKQGGYKAAEGYSMSAVRTNPTPRAYSDLGVSYHLLGDDSDAMRNYQKGLTYGGVLELYQNLSALTVGYGSEAQDVPLLAAAESAYPHDPAILTNIALFDVKHNDTADAKIVISKAAQYGHVSSFVYDHIINDEPFSFKLQTSGQTIYFK